MKVVTLRNGKQLSRPIKKESEIEIVKPQSRARQSIDTDPKALVDNEEKKKEKREGEN